MAQIASTQALASSRVWVAEGYVAATDPRPAEALDRALQERDGRSRLLHVLFLPADETYFAVYDGATPDPAQTPLDRVLRAVLLEPSPTTASTSAAAGTS
jgi:hypothetical protein